ncbi:MAG: hypothetical protein AB2L22_13275 [Syntrophales bacterium]
MQWKIGGVYYHVGPIIILNEDHDGDPDIISMAKGDIGFHELLHHLHLSSSSLGFVILYLEELLSSLHYKFFKKTKYTSMKHPYIESLAEDINDPQIKNLFMNVLLIFHIRSTIAGYSSEMKEQFYFPSDVYNGSAVLRSIYDSIFADDLGIFKDLDARLCIASGIPSAPMFYENNCYVGLDFIMEGLATDIVSLMSKRSKKRESSLVGKNSNEGQEERYEIIHDDIKYHKYNELRSIFYDGWSSPDHQHFKNNPYGGFVETYLALAELAMNPPILPSQLHLWKRKPSWFDIHPGYRFSNLCLSISRIGSCPELGRDINKWHEPFMNYLDHASRYMEWPIYSESMNSIMQFNSGSNSLFVSRQIEAKKKLITVKLNNIGAYLLGQSNPQIDKDCMPIAILGNETFVDNCEPGQLGFNMLPVLNSILLNEIYFGNSIKLTASLLWPFEESAVNALSHKLEEFTMVEGIADALIEEDQRVRRTREYKRL